MAPALRRSLPVPLVADLGLKSIRRAARPSNASPQPRSAGACRSRTCCDCRSLPGAGPGRCGQLAAHRFSSSPTPKGEGRASRVLPRHAATIGSFARQPWEWEVVPISWVVVRALGGELCGGFRADIQLGAARQIESASFFLERRSGLVVIWRAASAGRGLVGLSIRLIGNSHRTNNES
jgi:hypothetical protein